MTYKPESGETW